MEMRKRTWKILLAALLAGCLTAGLYGCGNGEHQYVFVEGKAATCTEAGVRPHYHCDHCGKDFDVDDRSAELNSLTIEPLGHDFNTPVTSRASCTEPGSAERTCRVCGYVEKTELAAGEHLFRSYITDATCLKEGQSYKVCLICGYSETQVIPATGAHSFGTDNVCKLCNLRCVPSEGLQYEVVYDNGMQVGYRVSCGDAEGSIVIPYYHESLPVLEVADEGFAGEPITGLVCYAPLRTIGERAFMNCRKLSSVTLPDTLEKIEAEAFSTSAITSISIPDSVKEIGGYTFYQCDMLKIVEVGAGLQSVGEYDFWNCGQLTVINVSEDNQALSSTGNCLIVRATETLIAGGVESVIPEDVKVIGKAAFIGRRGMKKIVIPKSVVKISDYAFRDCADLVEIQYEGSQADWELIEKGTEWDAHTDSECKVTFGG